MKTEAILKVFKDSFASDDFGGTLKAEGINLQCRTNDNLSLIEVAFINEERYNCLNSKERYFVVTNLLTRKDAVEDLGINAQKRVIKGIFTSICEASEQIKCFILLLETMCLNPNIFIDGKLLIEYALWKLSETGVPCGDVVCRLIRYPNLDVKCRSSAGEPVSTMLFRREFRDCLNIECFLMLAYKDPKVFDRKTKDTNAFMQAITNVARVNDQDVGKIILLSRFVPSSLLLVNEEKGTLRFFEIVTPANKNRFGQIPALVESLVMHQDSRANFIKGLIKYFISCQTPYVDDLKKSFVEVLNIISFEEIFDILEADKLKKELVNFLICLFDSLAKLPMAIKNTCHTYIESEIDKELLFFGRDYVVTSKDLSLLLGLKGKAAGGFSFEGGDERQNALYINKLLSGLVLQEHSLGFNKGYLQQVLIKSAYYSIKTSHWATGINDEKQRLILQRAVLDIAKDGLLVLTGWSGHAITLFIKGDYLFRCNGGGCSYDSTIEVYKITKPQELTEDILESIYKKRESDDNKFFIQQELHELLGLNLVCCYSGIFQRAGNCSLYSTLLGIQAMMASCSTNGIDHDVLVHAGNELPVLIRMLRYEGIILGAKDNPSMTKIMISRAISMEHGRKSLKVDREFLTMVLKRVYIEIDEYVVLSQMYECFIVEKSSFSHLQTFKLFLKSLGIYPFELHSSYGVCSKILYNAINNYEALTCNDINLFHTKVEEFTLLHIAVLANNIPLAKLVLETLAKTIDKVDINGMAPIGYVVTLDMLKLLLHHGAKTEWGSEDHRTAAYILSERASYEIIVELLHAGARVAPSSLTRSSYNPDPNIQLLLLSSLQDESLDFKGQRTALHVAAGEGDISRVKDLVRRPDVRSAKEINGFTPLFEAARRGCTNVALFLAKHPQVMAITPFRGDRVSRFQGLNGMSQEDILSIEDLRQDKIDNFNYFVDKFLSSSKYTRHMTAKTKTPEFWIITAINEQDRRGFKGALLYFSDKDIWGCDRIYMTTVLHRALEVFGLDEFTKELLMLPGVPLNYTDGIGNSLAHSAAEKNNCELLEFLKSIGAPMDMSNESGATPIMTAIAHGNLDAARFFITLPGINLKHTDLDGTSIMSLARKTNMLEIIPLLDEYMQKDGLLLANEPLLYSRATQTLSVLF